jgi:hypothetical protein
MTLGCDLMKLRLINVLKDRPPKPLAIIADDIVGFPRERLIWLARKRTSRSPPLLAEL